jgi:flagellar protein FlaF
MYKFSYAEILENAGNESRAREQLAIDHAIELLEKADAEGPHSGAWLDAVNYLNRLWSFLISDLTSPENGLDANLRADLVSIGMWMMRETDAVLQNPEKGMGSLIAINKTIREGLK